MVWFSENKVQTMNFIKPTLKTTKSTLLQINKWIWVCRNDWKQHLKTAIEMKRANWKEATLRPTWAGAVQAYEFAISLLKPGKSRQSHQSQIAIWKWEIRFSWRQMFREFVQELRAQGQINRQRRVWTNERTNISGGSWRVKFYFYFWRIWTGIIGEFKLCL